MNMHWSAAYVGQPWSPARNCWWLVQHIQLERWGRRMPTLEIAGPFTWEQWRTLSELLRDSPWHRVQTTPIEGDVLVTRGASGPHVGVFIDRRRVLHNYGWIDAEDGMPRGAIRVDLLADMLAGGYSRPEVWRHL